MTAFDTYLWSSCVWTQQPENRAMRQLELNLTSRAEHDGEAAPWRYRFTKNALVEELDGIRHVYGLWESLF